MFNIKISSGLQRWCQDLPGLYSHNNVVWYRRWWESLQRPYKAIWVREDWYQTWRKTNQKFHSRRLKVKTKSENNSMNELN